MIEVNNIDFLNDGKPIDFSSKPLVASVCITSRVDNVTIRIKVIFISTETSETYAQVLCDEIVEDIPSGTVEFDLECKPPKLENIPREHLLGLSSIVFIFYTSSGKEFARAGYFARVEYPGIMLQEEEGEVDELDEYDSADEGYYSEDEDDEVELSGEIIDEEINEDEEEDEDEGYYSDEDEDEEEINDDEGGVEEELSGDNEEEINEEELSKEGNKVIVTPVEFQKMNIDFSKINIEVLEPPLVTIFDEAWEETISKI